VPVGVAVLAMLGGAAGSGLLIADAAAQVARRPDDETETELPLLVVPSDRAAGYLAHSSHSSHSSHASHSSHSSGGYGGGGGGYDLTPSPTPIQPPPPPPPPKPATVSFAAYPGGRIFVNGQLVGHDTSGTMTLKPGTHTVRVENRFLGEQNGTVEISEGQTGVVEIDW